MTNVSRLRLLTAAAGAAAATVAVAAAMFGDSMKERTVPPAVAVTGRTPSERFEDEFARSKFATQPTLVFKTGDAPAVFAWQLKPANIPASIRPRDVLVMVDTSASQAGEHLRKARQIISALAQNLNGSDRIDLWTVNLDHPQGTRSLTRGFQPAHADEVQAAAASLTEVEYGSGATDLMAGIQRAMAAFERNPSRNQVILYLGDGESTASKTPLDEKARVDLGERLEQANITFFGVPLGVRINSHVLHGLASLTGGTVVRLLEDVSTERGRSIFASKLKTAFDVPVLKPEQVTFGSAVAEVFPSRLPPLRSDRPTLVLGTLAHEAPSLTAKLQGTVAGRPVTIEVAERLAAPEAENYFLHAMLEQWRTAANKDEPAILAADRALALASQQFRLFREEFLTQAVYAITSDRIDQAEKLYEAALRIDPVNPEARAGLRVVAKVRGGEIAPARLKGHGSQNQARVNLTNLAQEDPARQDPAQQNPGRQGQEAARQPGAQPAADAKPDDTLRQAQAERAIQEQQFRVLVDETVRRARALLTTDPDSAYEDLKRQRDVVLANTQLSETFRAKLAADLEAAMQTISTKGAEIKRRAAEERERIARTTLRINEFERQRAAEEATKSQIDAFRQLMQQARFELAQQEAQVMIQDRIARGQVVPPEAVASYMIGQAATNYREYRELIRIREDRYLLTMMQAEKSFIPYPDEPPVHFPPAAVWRELTGERARTASGTLGGNMTRSQREMQDILEKSRIRFEQSLEGLTLDEFLKTIEQNHNLKFVVLEEEFKLAGELAVREKRMNLKQSLYGLTVGSALDIALQNIQLTYIVRPEYIEICNYDKRLREKVVQTFDIGQLVYDIPSSVNQAVLFQNQNVQAQNLALFGAATFAGGFGGIGGLGLGGGFAALGGLAIGGGGQPGFAAQGAGVLGAGGTANNLGIGGGVAGIGGGQLGQFGNLGGQFGIQGNALQNYQLIAMLVMEVVARGEWADLGGQFNVTQIPGQNNNIPFEPIPKVVKEEYLNSLAYYPPARAMIVRGTGKYHPESSIKLKTTDGSVRGGPGNPLRDDVAQANPNTNPAAAAPAPAGRAPAAPASAGPASTSPATPPTPARDPAIAQFRQIDRRVPQQMWQQALALSNVTDPGVIVAAADFLVEYQEFNHAAEVLKTGIRSGLTTDGWAQEALAVALKSAPGGGQTFEAERASMSAIDLEPADPKSYIRAAKASEEAGKIDLALAYCQRAAELDPNLAVAYANALTYAEKADDLKTDAIAWASANLLQRDWPLDTVDYHAETRERLGRIVRKFEAAGRKDQVEPFSNLLESEGQRDLVIELLWQGEADLDLYVAEPTGSIAGPTMKRTSGGGVLKGDILEQGNDRSETYTAAQAFSGTYLVSARRAFKSSVGDKAQVKVTKFKGTPRESVEFYTLHLSQQEPIAIHLDGGSRTELVMLPDPEPAELTLASLPRTEQHGFVAVVGTPTGRTAGRGTNLPTVIKPFETKLPGVTQGAPSMRAEAVVSPDRKQVRISVNPVFSTATEIPMPKVSLLPGGGR